MKYNNLARSLPGTLNNQFNMDVWRNTNFSYKDLASSNWFQVCSRREELADIRNHWKGHVQSKIALECEYTKILRELLRDHPQLLQVFYIVRYFWFIYIYIFIYLHRKVILDMVLKKDLLQFLGFKQLLGTIARWWFPIWGNDPIWRAFFCSKRVSSATAKRPRICPSKPYPGDSNSQPCSRLSTYRAGGAWWLRDDKNYPG